MIRRDQTPSSRSISVAPFYNGILMLNVIRLVSGIGAAPDIQATQNFTEAGA